MHEGLNVVHPTDVAPETWANGGGRTRTLLAWPDPENWWLRISVADVERSGPFSVFSGVDRWFAVLDGDGVRLRTPGRLPAVLSANEPGMHAFRGDDLTACELLGGPTRDLNVMVRRRQAQATVRALQPGALQSDAEVLGYFVLDDGALVVGTDEPVALPAYAFAWIANPARAALECRFSGSVPRGWWLEISRRPAVVDK